MGLTPYSSVYSLMDHQRKHFWQEHSIDLINHYIFQDIQVILCSLTIPINCYSIFNMMTQF